MIKVKTVSKCFCGQENVNYNELYPQEQWRQLYRDYCTNCEDYTWQDVITEEEVKDE